MLGPNELEKIANAQADYQRSFPNRHKNEREKELFRIGILDLLNTELGIQSSDFDPRPTGLLKR